MKLRRKNRTRSGNGIADQLRPRVRGHVQPVDPEPEEPDAAEEIGAGDDEAEAASEPGEPSDSRRRHRRRRFRPTTAKPQADQEKVNGGDAANGRTAPLSAGAEAGADRPPRLIIKGNAAPAPVKAAPRPMKAADKKAGSKPVAATDSTPELPRLERKKNARHLAKRSRDVAVEAVAGAPDKEEEEEWSGKKTRVNWRWVTAISLGMTATVVGGLAVIETMNRTRRNEGIRAIPELEIAVDRRERKIDDHSGFLAEKPGELLDEAIALLSRYGTARTPDEAMPTIRDEEGTRERFVRHWAPWDSRPLVERRELLSYAIASESDPAFMALWGLRADFSPFRAYFTRENNRLRIDWEATEMFSDVPIGKLPENAPGQPVFVRCLTKEKPFYTVSLPEDRYRSYLIEEPGTHDFVWGYAARDSEADQKLQDAFTFRAAFLKHKDSERVIVRMATPEQRETDSQFLITEMLHIEWVLP